MWKVALVAVVVAACQAPTPVSPTPPAPAAPTTAEIETTLRAFLHHFENLEWEPFIASFSDDACVFHPTAKTPQSFCGRDEVRAKWQEVFAGIRAGAKSGPPFMHLDPQALHVVILGPDAALATFELRNEERVARRSVVFVRAGGAWKIVHVHASNVPWPDAP